MAAHKFTDIFQPVSGPTPTTTHTGFVMGRTSGAKCGAASAEHDLRDLVDAGLGTMPKGMTFKMRDGGEMPKPEQPILTTDKVRFAGDPVAVVVAETAKQAKDAAEAVFADIDTLPAVTDAAAAAAPGAPLLHDATPGNVVLDFHHGDTAAVEAAFAKAAPVAAVAAPEAAAPAAPAAAAPAAPVAKAPAAPATAAEKPAEADAVSSTEMVTPAEIATSTETVAPIAEVTAPTEVAPVEASAPPVREPFDHFHPGRDAWQRPDSVPPMPGRSGRVLCIHVGLRW